ncbi:MAG: formylglycine-generating enzyme family protein [Victivallaceae bacterium]
MKFITGIMLTVMCCAALSLTAEDLGKPVSGSDWKIPDIGMEFVWIKALNCWVGKYEVTNGEYRKFKPDHDSRSYDGNSLNGDSQPVVYVNFDDAVNYAKWLTERERKAGRIPAGYSYRLPTQKEWTTFCQCGDSRKFPWGKSMPPKYGHYAMSNDGFPVSCPVEKSGMNDWGLYGVGGNVWECTVKSESDLSFAGWRGAAWFTDEHPDYMCSLYTHKYSESGRLNVGGFRLVLSH